MSKLVRVLILGAMLAAMNLAGMTAAHAHPTTGDAAQSSLQGGRTQQEQRTIDATRRGALAQERYYTTWRDGDPARERALAQERYYSTWRDGQATDPVRLAAPSRRPGWLVASLTGLAAALALSGGLALLAARRARHKARLGQAA
jgi:hypothetical protein